MIIDVDNGVQGSGTHFTVFTKPASIYPC